MRVLMATTAGAGHLGPLVPFAAACRRAGHDVVVAAPAEFAPVVERAGLPAWPLASVAIGEDERQAVFARVPGLSHDEANLLVITEIFGRIDTGAMLGSMVHAVREWSPDLVLREMYEYSSWLAAEAAGVAHARVGIGLTWIEAVIPAAVARTVAPLRAGLGLDRDLEGEGMARSPLFTLTPASLEDPARPTVAVTARVRDPKAPPGPRSGADGGDGRPDDPLVYVTFGTVAPGMGPLLPVLNEVVAAVAALPVRVLVTVGDTVEPATVGDLGPNVRVEGWVAQAEVLASASAVVCHGGYGTVLGALGAGVPVVAVPLFADQPYNAERLEAVGAGLAVHPGEGLRERCSAAVARVLDDRAIRAAAVGVADEIAALPSVDELVAGFPGTFAAH